MRSVRLTKTEALYLNSPTHGRLGFDEALSKVLEFIASDKDSKFRIIVGTDSAPRSNGSNSTEYIIALVIHRIGSGGIYFWQKIHRPKAYSLRQRMYEEALLSLRFAENLTKELDRREIFNKEVEIHVDIGNSGETRKMINEVAGMIRSNGFMVKTKPEAFGASSVADRHT